jgi:6-phosphogluconate dehydrogenase
VKVVSTAAVHGIPLPGMSAALAYYDGLRCERLPANLLQAQRDFFGAHQFERIDKKRGTRIALINVCTDPYKGEFFHVNWTGRGGSTASSSYTI